MIETPTIDWAGLSPLIALLGGALVVLVVGLARPRWVREGAVPVLLFGLAPGRACPFHPVETASRPTDSSLLRWSSPHGGRALPAILLYGAQTFL